MQQFSFFAPDPSLAAVVEAIWDAEVLDTGDGTPITIRVLPSVSPIMCFHYRTPHASRSESPSRHPHQTLSGVQTSPLALRPGTILGAVMVHFKAEAACHVVGGQMAEFLDAHVQIDSVLRAREVSHLDERLAGAPNAASRSRLVQDFLRLHLRDKNDDRLVQFAADELRRHPNVPVRRLAAQLNISERHLTRRFRDVIGATPKQFSRVARLGRAVAARRRGLAWADISYGCGFTDQAHLVNDFCSLVGTPPEAYLREASGARWRKLNAALAMSDFCNTFFA
jgi:AraC-like DNA-binding protein